MPTNRYGEQFSTNGTTLDNTIRTDAGRAHGRVRFKSLAPINASGVVGEVPVLDAADVVVLGKVKSNDRPVQLWFQSDDLGTTGTIDIGLYRVGSDGSLGAVVDADAFATAINVNTAAVARTEVLTQSGVVTFEERGKTIWQILGLTSDPGIEYYICFTAATATTAAGTMVAELYYTSGD